MRTVVIVLGLLAALAAPLRAGELVMFDEPGCIWCARWTEEIGPIYSKTAEGKLAPLRRMDIRAPRPDDLKAIKPVRFTPTFVLVHDGQEIGRIEGYPGEDFFWGLLGKMLRDLPQDDLPWQARET